MTRSGKLASLLVAVFVASWIVPTVDMAPEAPRTAPACVEDEPCWDCQTMGNRVCGPVDN